MHDPGSPSRPRETELIAELLRPIPAGSENENMMLVSPNFDILMLHPSWEALWHRPVSTFLGKKCYCEIEKRQEPCPHCPGVIALQSGAATEVESCAILDDGTRVPFLLRALPIYGAAGEPAGFVETCVNISERRRGESEARFEVGLINDLLAAGSTSRVLTLGLDAALRLDGAESGCVFGLEQKTGAKELVAQRGVLAADMETFPTDSAATTVAVQQGSSLLLRVPVIHNGETIAELAVWLSGDMRAWPGTRSRLEVIASVLALSLARLKAERLRGDAGADLQTLLRTIPTAAVMLDRRGIITAYNQAAETLFGWPRRDALGHLTPFVPSGEEAGFMSLVSRSHGYPPAAIGSRGADTETCAAGPSRAGPPAGIDFMFRCLRKDGSRREVRFRSAAVHDVTGNGTAFLVIATQAGSSQVVSRNDDAQAEDELSEGLGGSIDRDTITAVRSLERLLGRLVRNGSPSFDVHVSLNPADCLPGRPLESAHALVVQNDEESGRRLAGILGSLGCSAVVCTSISDAIGTLRTSREHGAPPDFAIVDMVMPEEPGAVETAKLLRKLEPRLQVVVSSERGVVGHTAHGFAAAISRPYADETVKTAAIEALRQRSR